MAVVTKFEINLCPDLYHCVVFVGFLTLKISLIKKNFKIYRHEKNIPIYHAWTFLAGASIR
jgi:hypothetical protein